MEARQPLKGFVSSNLYHYNKPFCLLVSCIISIGYSQKGYIDGDLLAEWIKHFDQYTKRKAGRRPRYIFLDSHMSRLHLPFLLYCRENNIHVLSYPSHSTHIYQGLDVVVFSVLKRYFSDEMLRFEARTGTAVNKTNFLAVYTPAHVQAFTKENIQMAFAKTGIYPYNPDIIAPSVMKPSIETSITGPGLTLVPPTPVRTMAKFITDAAALLPKNHVNIPIDPGLVMPPTMPVDSLQIINELRSSSASILINQSPIRSTYALPVHVAPLNAPFTIPREILSKVPETELEQELQDCYFELARREAVQHGTLVSVQSCMVLQTIYCERLRSQLFTKENNSKQKKGSGRLLGDGLPRCLTADDFFAKVLDFVERQAQEEIEKTKRREDRSQFSTVLAEWKRLEGERKRREDLKTEEFAAAIKLWKAETALARAEKRKSRMTRPVRGPRERAIPKPKRPSSSRDDLEEIDIFIDNNSGDSDADESTSEA